MTIHDISRNERIAQILRTKFAPVLLQVEDDSARHAGHSGASEAGESHFNIKIASSQLDQLSRIQAHRAINDALAAEFKDGLHALSIRIIRTEQAGQK